MELDIDAIIHDTQRRVKGYSDQDKTRMQTSNDLNTEDWIEEILTRQHQPAQQAVDPTMRKAKLHTDRRIADQDFRDRFPDSDYTETERRTEACLKESLKKYSRCYTRSLRLVAELGDTPTRREQK